MNPVIYTPTHYLALDLSRCSKIEVVSLRILYDPARSSLLPGIADFLAPFLARCIPTQLRCLNMQISHDVGGGEWPELPHVSSAPLEDLLLLALHEGRIKTISITPWSRVRFEAGSWPEYAAIFPRLLKEKRLLDDNGLADLPGHSYDNGKWWNVPARRDLDDSE